MFTAVLNVLPHSSGIAVVVDAKRPVFCMLLISPVCTYIARNDFIGASSVTCNWKY